MDVKQDVNQMFCAIIVFAQNGVGMEFHWSGILHIMRELNIIVLYIQR